MQAATELERIKGTYYCQKHLRSSIFGKCHVTAKYWPLPLEEMEVSLEKKNTGLHLAVCGPCSLQQKLV